MGERGEEGERGEPEESLDDDFVVTRGDSDSGREAREDVELTEFTN